MIDDIGLPVGLIDAAASVIASKPSIEGGTIGCYENFNLIEIPGVMKRAGRTVGAQLMERWFRNPGFTMPVDWKRGEINQQSLPKLFIDTSIVKMKWLMNFHRARLPFIELKKVIQGGNTISLQRSKTRLFTLLKSNNKFLNVPTTFGNSTINANVIEVHQTSHLNSRPTGTNILDMAFDPLDDLYCSLGAFTAQMAASGHVVPIKGGKSGRATHQVTISKLGFYIRDCYDFNEDQPLGYWNAQKFSKFPGSELFTVDNEIFRDWRFKHGRGCDFIIFSDIQWEAAPHGLIWEYPF